MKVTDIVTNNLLETNNELVISQFQKYAERYVPVKDEKTKPIKE